MVLNILRSVAARRRICVTNAPRHDDDACARFQSSEHRDAIAKTWRTHAARYQKRSTDTFS